jgi:hypothetical protein
MANSASFLPGAYALQASFAAHTHDATYAPKVALGDIDTSAFAAGRFWTANGTGGINDLKNPVRFVRAHTAGGTALTTTHATVASVTVTSLVAGDTVVLVCSGLIDVDHAVGATAEHALLVNAKVLRGAVLIDSEIAAFGSTVTMTNGDNHRLQGTLHHVTEDTGQTGSVTYNLQAKEAVDYDTTTMSHRTILAFVIPA